MKTIRRATKTQFAVTALLPALATILSLLPAVLDLETEREIIPVVLAAPVVVAFVTNLLLPPAGYKYRPLLAALPLPFIFPIMVMLSVAIYVARGHPSDSSEVAMAWGIGLIVSPIIGLIVGSLTAIFGLLGVYLCDKPAIARVVLVGLLLILGYGLVRLAYSGVNPIPDMLAVLTLLIICAVFGWLAALLSERRRGKSGS